MEKAAFIAGYRRGKKGCGGDSYREVYPIIAEIFPDGDAYTLARIYQNGYADGAAGDNWRLKKIMK
jgi:hypothetical protein